MEILISLCTSYREGFKAKPGLDELLNRQPRRGAMSKRAAVEELVSPRKVKLPRNFDAPRIGFFSPSKTQPSALNFNFDDDTPTPSSPTPVPPRSLPHQPSTPSLRLLPHPDPDSPPTLLCSPPYPTPGPTNTHQNPARVQREKAVRFPTNWPAHIVLEKTSAYVQEREGRHGSFPEVFQKVFGIDHYPKTMASLLLQLYPAAYHHFHLLDYNDRVTITWSKLISRFDITKKDSVGIPFVYFVHPSESPARPPAIGPIKTPQAPTSSPGFVSLVPTLQAEGHPSQPTSLSKVDLLSPLPLTPPATTLFPLNKEILQPLSEGPIKTSPAPTSPPGFISSVTMSQAEDYPSQPTSLFPTPHTTTPFPLDKVILQPLSEGQQASLEANLMLVHDTQKALGNLVVDHDSGINQLVERNTYSWFNAHDTLKKLQAVANSSGWPNPPDFSSLPQRVWEKQIYLGSIIFEIQMASAGILRFYTRRFSMTATE